MSDAEVVGEFRARVQYDEQGKREGYIVDQADPLIEAAPEVLAELAVDENGCVVVDALNGCYLYRFAGVRSEPGTSAVHIRLRLVGVTHAS